VTAPLDSNDKPEMLDDGFGNQWPMCRADCALQIVRPGKVQCEAEDCPHRIDNPGYYP